MLRDISCIHRNDVVADHSDHGEKAKQVGKIVKSLMWNHRRYSLNTNKRDGWALHRDLKEEKFDLFATFPRMWWRTGLFVHCLVWTGQDGCSTISSPFLHTIHSPPWGPLLRDKVICPDVSALITFGPCLNLELMKKNITSQGLREQFQRHDG